LEPFTFHPGRLRSKVCGGADMERARNLVFTFVYNRWSRAELGAEVVVRNFQQSRAPRDTFLACAEGAPIHGECYSSHLVMRLMLFAFFLGKNSAALLTFSPLIWITHGVNCGFQSNAQVGQNGLGQIEDPTREKAPATFYLQRCSAVQIGSQSPSKTC